jgi:hypothetical protein
MFTLFCYETFLGCQESGKPLARVHDQDAIVLPEVMQKSPAR